MTKGIRKLFLGLFLVAIVSISCQVQAKAADYHASSGIDCTVDSSISSLDDGSECEFVLSKGGSDTTIFKFNWDTTSSKWIVSDAGKASDYGINIDVSTDITKLHVSTADSGKLNGKLFGNNGNTGTFTIIGKGSTTETIDTYAYDLFGVPVSLTDSNETGLVAYFDHDGNTYGYVDNGADFNVVFNRELDIANWKHESLLDSDDNEIKNKSGFSFTDAKTLAVTAVDGGKAATVGGLKYKYDVVSDVTFGGDLSACPVGKVTNFSLDDIVSAYGKVTEDNSSWQWGDVVVSGAHPSLRFKEVTTGSYSIEPTEKGTYTLKVTISDGLKPDVDYTKDITVVVSDEKQLTEIKFEETSKSVPVGAENAVDLKIVKVPSDATIDVSKIKVVTESKGFISAKLNSDGSAVTVTGEKAGGPEKVTISYDGLAGSSSCSVTVTDTPPGEKVSVDLDSFEIKVPVPTSAFTEIDGLQIVADVDGTPYYYANGGTWKEKETFYTFSDKYTKTIKMTAATVKSMLKSLGKTLKAIEADVNSVTITVYPASSKKADTASGGSDEIDAFWIELDTSENAASYTVDGVETKEYFYGFPGLSYEIAATGKTGYTFKKWEGVTATTEKIAAYEPDEDATLTAVYEKGSTPAGDGESVVSLIPADMYIKVPAVAAGMTDKVTGVVLLASTGAVNYEYNGSGWVKVASATPNPYYCLSVSGTLSTGYYEMAASSVKSMLKSLGWQLKNDGVDASIITLYAFPCNRESLAVDATKYALNFDTILMSKISLSYEKNAAAYIVDSSTMTSSSNAYFNAFNGVTYSLISQGNSSFKFSKWDGDTSRMSNTTSSSMNYSAPNSAQSITAVYESSSSSSSSSSMRTSSSSSSSSMTGRGGSSGSGDYDEVPKTGESKTDIWILWGVLLASILGAGFMIYKRFGLVKAIARAEEDEAREALAAEKKEKEDRINMITDLRNLK